MEIRQLYRAVSRRLARHDVEGAQRLIDSAQKGPPTWRVLSLKASVYEFDGQVDRAEQLLGSAIRKAKGDPRPALELIELLIDAGRTAKARAEIRRVRRLYVHRRKGKTGQQLAESLVVAEARLAGKAGGKLEIIRVLAFGLAEHPASGRIRRLLVDVLTGKSFESVLLTTTIS